MLWLSIALVVVACVLSWTALRLAAVVVVEGDEWRAAARYYVDGRVGLLDETVGSDEPPPLDAEGIADELFDAWHEACGWRSEEQATHVRMLWKVAFRSQAGQRQKAEALTELRGLGAPIPGGHHT